MPGPCPKWSFPEIPDLNYLSLFKISCLTSHITSTKGTKNHVPTTENRSKQGWNSRKFQSK